MRLLTIVGICLVLVGCVPANKAKPKPKPDGDNSPQASTISAATKRLVLDWADVADSVADKIGSDIKNTAQMQQVWNEGIQKARARFSSNFDSIAEPLVIPPEDPKDEEGRKKWEQQAKAGWKKVASELRKSVK